MAFSRSITHVIGKLPLAGKNFMRSEHSAGLRAAHRGDRGRALEAKEILSDQSVTHIFAAFVGTIATVANTINSIRYGGALYPTETVYDAGFTLINAGCAYTQIQMSNHLQWAIDRFLPDDITPGQCNVGQNMPTLETVTRPSLDQSLTNKIGYLAFGATVAHGLAGTFGLH